MWCSRMCACSEPRPLPKKARLGLKVPLPSTVNINYALSTLSIGCAAASRRRSRLVPCLFLHYLSDSTDRQSCIRDGISSETLTVRGCYRGKRYRLYKHVSYNTSISPVLLGSYILRLGNAVSFDSTLPVIYWRKHSHNAGCTRDRSTGGCARGCHHLLSLSRTSCRRLVNTPVLFIPGLQLLYL